MKNFLIDYFVDKESFIDLQIDFLKQDFVYNMNSELFTGFERVLRKEDFYIEEQIPLPQSEDPNGISFLMQKLYFYETYLTTVISKLSSNYLNDFYNYIREDLLEDQRKRRKFLNDEKKRISLIYDNIEQFNFINIRLFTEIKAQLIEIEKALHSPTLYNDKYLKFEKLALTGWKEQDLLMFFNFLRTEKVIDKNVTDADLGLFLERNFCVEKDDVATSLDNINKKLHDFNTGIKKTHKTEVRLKRLFDKF